MGKNKKRDKKTTQPQQQDEAAALPIGSLTISGGPTTSEDASAEATPQEEIVKTPADPPKPAETEPEEEGLGLGLGGGRTRPKKKFKAQAGTADAAPAAEPASTKTPDVPATPAVEEAEPEGDGLGLGLGGGGRKRPKKKPKAQQTAAQQSGPAQGQAGLPGAAAPGPAAPAVVTPTQIPGFAPPAQIPGFGPPVQIPGFGPPAQIPGFGPPAQIPGFGPPAQIPGFGPPAPIPGFGPPGQSPGLPQPQQAGAKQVPFPGFKEPQAPTARPASQPKPTGPQKGQGAAPATSQEVVRSRFAIPARIEGNKVAARKIKMLVNYLAMNMKPIKVYRYDATFVPEKPKKAIPLAFQAAIKKNFAKFANLVAFDQFKNFYSTEMLPNMSGNERFADHVEVLDDNGKTMKFEVSFKPTGVVDYNTLVQYMKTGATSLTPPLEAIQAIDVILRQGTLQSYKKAGRQFFKRPSNPISLGEGLEMWTGLFQSAIFTTRPFINIDVAHKGFPIHQPLIKALDAFRLDPSKPVDTQRGRGLEGFLYFLKGLRVVARIGGDATSKAQKREFICNGIAEPASRQKFMLTDPSGRQRQVTVADYFREKGCRLQYPNQNCMWVGPRDKNIYYPMEILEVSYGQVRSRQLTEMQLSTMVREAATPPDQRKRKIEEVIRDMKYVNNPFFKKFGLEISDKFTEVDGKVLNPPRMDCGPGSMVNPRKGAWQSDRLLLGKAMDNWGIIAVEMDPRTANVEQLESMFRSIGGQMGMQVSAPSMRQANVAVSALEGVMRTAYDRRLQMLVVVVSARTRDVYSHVKKVAERSVGVLTQCIKEFTAARKCNNQTIRNILLKVNSKLMGINHALDSASIPACMRAGNVMVVGADVTHPSPDQTNIPSIAAVTASIDRRCFKYNIEFSIQTPKKEMILEFEDMMVDHLKMYRNELKALPAKIYVYRDGVSEGQFPEVMNSELQAVYNAYARLSGGKGRPEVMFLLVQKRHHTRFFLGDSQYNVEPGTVVDSTIVHPRELDFYLVSHQAIKGTARPTRYHAICNDGRLPHDEVEQLTFYLCHLYSRCSRSVSYPTPTYYAHLACLRARTLTHNETFDNEALEKSPIRLHVKPRVQETSPMFFV